ncbi:MAG: hypothetical protein P8Y29_02535 [Gemmatimonadota bacterium]
MLASVLALGVSIPLSGQVADNPLVIHDVTLIDSSGAPPAPHTTLVIEKRRITAFGPASEIVIPDKARVVDGRGRFVIPGLWDLHVHAMREGRSRWHFPLYLANGVTGVREMGTFLDSLDSWQARLAAGYPGPRIVAAGHIDTGPPPPGAVRPPPGRPTPAWVFAIPITSGDQARVVVDSLIRRGVDFVKVYGRHVQYGALRAHDREFCRQRDASRADPGCSAGACKSRRSNHGNGPTPALHPGQDPLPMGAQA